MRGSFLRSTPTISRPPGDEHGAEDAQQALGLGGREIADGGAGEEAGLGARGNVGREGDGIGEIADDGAHVEGREARGEPPGGIIEGALRTRRSSRRQPSRGRCPSRISVLRLEPEPNSTSAPPSGTSAGHLGGVRFEDRGFGAGRIVLGETRDLLEQLAAPRVVEVAAGERLLRPGQVRR